MIWRGRHASACGYTARGRCTTHKTGCRGGAWESLLRGSLTGTPNPAEALVEWSAWQAETTLQASNRDIRDDFRAEIREFLGTRRARVTPEQAGLPIYGGERRRVTGLRREEVALLAGISSEYYTRLERGNATGVSESVIEGIAQALQLDEAERDPPARPPARRRHDPSTTPPPRPARVRPTVQRVLDSMTGTPAFVLNGRGTSWPPTTSGAPCSPRSTPTRYGRPTTPGSSSSDPHATEFFRHWDEVANDTVAMLRAEAGRDLYDRRLSDLIGELSTRSEEFRRRWAAHNVRIHTTGVKLLHHPVVGDLDLPFETFPLGADPSQFLLTYTAEPASPTRTP